MANAWKTRLDGYQVMRTNYTDINDTCIEMNFHLWKIYIYIYITIMNIIHKYHNIYNLYIYIYINISKTHNKNKQYILNNIFSVFFMVLNHVFCCWESLPPHPQRNQGTRGFPRHGWPASSRVRHAIPDESLRGNPIRSSNFMDKKCLEDHPKTCKWLISPMVIVSPLTEIVPFTNSRFMVYT